MAKEARHFSTTEVTHPLAGQSFHLFQHIRPVLRPFSLYHFHCDSWQDIFNVALLLQDGTSTLMSKTGISTLSMTMEGRLKIEHKTDDHMNTTMLLSYIHLIKAAWHTPLNGPSLAAACCSIWTCNKNKTSFLAALLPLTCWSLLFLICEENIRLTWLRAPRFANQSVSQQLAELCQLIVSHMGRTASCSL